jgi:hypothetical protein
MADDYDYFELEGAYFRRHRGLGTRGVHDVRAGNAWAPYKGDPLRPATFGDQVSEEEATRGMDAANPRPTSP